MLRSRERSFLPSASRGDFERRNMHLVALLISFAALAREKAAAAIIGSTSRTLPRFQRHSLVTRSPAGEPEIRFA